MTIEALAGAAIGPGASIATNGEVGAMRHRGGQLADNDPGQSLNNIPQKS